MQTKIPNSNIPNLPQFNIDLVHNLLGLKEVVYISCPTLENAMFISQYINVTNLIIKGESIAAIYYNADKELECRFVLTTEGESPVLLFEHFMLRVQSATPVEKPKLMFQCTAELPSAIIAHISGIIADHSTHYTIHTKENINE